MRGEKASREEKKKKKKVVLLGGIDTWKLSSHMVLQNSEPACNNGRTRSRAVGRPVA